MTEDVVRVQEAWPKFVRRVSPTLRTFLEHARIRPSEAGGLRVEMDPFGCELARSRDLARDLQAFVARLLGRQVPVEIGVGQAEGLFGLLAEMEEKEKQEELRVRERALRQVKAARRVLLGREVRQEPVPIRDVGQAQGTVVVRGRILRAEYRSTREGEMLVLALTDGTDSLTVKVFGTGDPPLPVEALGEGAVVAVRGSLQYDRFSREEVLVARDIQEASLPVREDRAPEKRVELHLHTKMSAMDGCLDLEEAVRRVQAWGHPAVAVTDHGVVQAFPEAASLAKKYGVRVLYGVELYLVDDLPPLWFGRAEVPFTPEDFVALDLETTSLSPRGGEILEIGAVRFVGGRPAERWHSLVRPTRPVPPAVVELTGITEDMVRDAPALEDVLPALAEFVEGRMVVAHNAQFDAGFLRAALARGMGRTWTGPVVDSLTLARALRPTLHSHRLDVVARELGIPLGKHHRAADDAETAGRVAYRLLQEGQVADWEDLADLSRRVPVALGRPFHAVVLVKEQRAVPELYRLISQAHLEDFHRVPRVRRSRLQEVRDGFFVGSGCDQGEVVQALLAGRTEEELEAVARFYDYLEVQPPPVWRHLVPAYVPGEEELARLIQDVVALGDRLGIPVAATGDAHFVDPEDRIFREILLRGQGGEAKHPSGELHLRTTEEMLEAFSFLPEETRRRVVVEVPQAIAAACQTVRPLQEGLHAPTLPGAAETVRELAMRQAREWYGDPLPPLVRERLERELQAIIGHGYAVIYLTAHKLVQRSLQDGYVVGSRGSVGSSLVATLCGITEVNPLPPHYRCPRCRFTEFPEGVAQSGFDLPRKDCPRCGTPLHKDGQDIPFETFMGLGGDKVPDIDLNFSGENQAAIHRFTEELFGKNSVFRAGTISTIAERTAYGLVKGWLEETGRTLRQAEIDRLAKGLVGVKRTTGQHPGGLIIVPKEQEVYAFTPVQHPADDMSSETVTTHFAFESLHDNLLKLDLLGHDDPTVLRMLEELTGVPAREVPLDDPDALSLFSSVRALHVDPADIGTDVGTLGLPEFGTRFVRQMCAETRPRTFADLVRISGLSHGTDVWVNNAQELVRSGTCTLQDVIATRDDIMLYLMGKGLAPARAFAIMEQVRKGKGLSPEDVAELKAHGVPDWYIASCQKITYMFPKAHAAAYVIMAVRIAYFKVHYPEAFYATYFTVRADEFDAQFALHGEEGIRQKLEELQRATELSTKERNLLTILEVAREMYARGIRFRPVNLWESDEVRFRITDQGLLPPLISLQGLGETAARNLGQARREAPFLSVEDLRVRAKLSKPVLDLLAAHGCLAGLPETNQLTLFG